MIVRRNGFTLLELLISVTIIAILAIIAVPNYSRSVERAKCSQGMGMLRSMRTAGLSFFQENETFSGLTIGDLETEVNANFQNTPDWNFSINTASATDLEIQASRNNGPWSGQVITLDQDEVWAGGYPINNPGNF